MGTKILITQNLPKAGLTQLFKDYYVIMPGKGGFTKEEQLELIRDADILLSIFNSPVDSTLINAAQKLRMIANFGVGYNNIDLVAAKNRDIIVTNTPDPVTMPTAEHTIGLMLALSRRISEMDRKLRQQEVNDWKVMSNLGHTLNGKTLGIIGLGKIGQATAAMAKVFGMNIIYHNRKPVSKVIETSLGVNWVELNQLLSQSDIVSLHVPLTEQTNHLIGHRELALMKESAYLINTARGNVVNELELVEALKNKVIAGAALDVFEEEPSINGALFTMDNVVLTPHIATGTIETRIATAQCATDNILAFLQGKQIPNRVI